MLGQCVTEALEDLADTTLPVPSTYVTSEVHLHDDGGDLTLSYEYQDEGQVSSRDPLHGVARRGLRLHGGGRVT